MTPVLYFHGFASSPGSAKIALLRPLLQPMGIELDVPDLNVPSFEMLDFDAMVAHGVRAALRNPPRALAGSSLGALVALAVAGEGIDVPLVLIAPALGISRRWEDELPEGDPVVVFNYARNANATVHRAFFEQMARLRIEERAPKSRVTVLMGRQDQTVPFGPVEETWSRWLDAGLAPGSSFVAIDGGDHSLVAHTGRIAQAIVEACR